MTKYFSDNEVDTIYGCVLNAIDNLEAIKAELNKDFKAPWYILEKIERVENYVACITNRAADANERDPEVTNG